jgi:quinol monooxygenase YgiN
MPINVFVRFVPKRGEEARVERVLRTMVSPTRAEPGCRRYDLFQAAGASGERIFCLLERFADEAAVEAHRETVHYKEYRANVVPLLAQPIEVTRLEVLDAKDA